MSLTLGRQNHARDRYTSLLQSSYSRWNEILDPDYALQQDPCAWDKILLDTKTAGAIMRRQAGAAGLLWHMTPATKSDDKSDARAAQIVDAIVRPNLRHFTMARYNMAEAIIRGDSYHKIKTTEKVQRLPSDRRARKWIVPTSLVHVDRMRFHLVRRTQDQLDKPKVFWEMYSRAANDDTGDWVTFTKKDQKTFVRHVNLLTESSLGYSTGILPRLYFYWRAKTILFTQGLSGMERWAQGLIHVKVDDLRVGTDTGRTNDDIVNRWIDHLEKTRSEHLIVGGKGDEIEVHDMPVGGHKGVIDLMAYCDNAIEQILLHSLMPSGSSTEAGIGTGQADVQKGEQSETFATDREAMSETLTETLIRRIWEANLPQIRIVLQQEGLNPEACMPRFVIGQEAQQDPQVNLSILVAALQHAPVLKSEFYTMLNLTMPPDNVDPSQVIQPSQTQAGGFGSVLQSMISMATPEQIEMAVAAIEQREGAVRKAA